MAFMAVLESDLRALSAEARRRYPAIKDGAEHAILKLRTLSTSSEIAQNDDILRIFLMACQVKTIKLSVIGLSCLQKLIAHDAVAPPALNEILVTLKDHGEMADEGVQLKTLQTVLIIFQSRLQPDSEEHTAQALGICLHLLENNKSSDSVRNTAAATFRQAVALIFDHVLSSESLPAGKFVHGGYLSRSASVTSDVNHSINNSKSLDEEFASLGTLKMRENPTKAGKLGLRLLEDLTALAAGGSAIWLRVGSIQRTFALDILEFILSNYVAVFRTLLPYEQVLRHQICSLLMTSLRTNSEIEGETGEPYYRRLVLRRNTAQKQWDETLVLVFGGIARILRTFFPLLRSITNFWSGWESLLGYVKNSIANGSKEVALAAVGCLQSTVLSHSPKGNLPMPYLKSVLDVYDIVLRNPTACNDMTANKVKQEIIQGLGEVYTHAQGMFESSMYSQLLSVIESAIKEAKITQNSFEAEFGHVPPLQRVVLDIFPQLRPPNHLPSLWTVFFQKLLHYLPNSDSSVHNGDAAKPVESRGYISESNGTSSNDQLEVESSSSSSDSKKASAVTISSDLFAEKLLPVLVDLFLQAPVAEKLIIFPYVIQGLGRCMITRRENPDGGLWGLAVKSFNQLLVNDVSKLKHQSGSDLGTYKPARIRFWKEVADVYEIFLVGYCGRALPSNPLAAISKEDDESLEMELLDVLGDKILMSDIDASPDIMQRLIITLDRCASRTCSLPVETVELVPPHCSRFSLTCLHKLFSLSSYNNESNNWNSTRTEVSKISVTILMTRCEYILKKYLTDEKDLGERPFPSARISEIAFVLQEMARVTMHPETASVLPLHPFLKGGLLEENTGLRAHLFVLFSPLCELVKSRNSRVRDLVQALLRLVSTELGLHKICLTN